MGRGNQHYMTEDERYLMEGMLLAGAGVTEIARKLGFCRQTIYNELKRGLYTHICDYREELRYSADKAQQIHQYNQTAKGRPLKIGNDRAYADFLEARMMGVQETGEIDRRKRYSPAAALELARREGFTTSVCVSTLYSYIDKRIFLHLTNRDLLDIASMHPTSAIEECLFGPVYTKRFQEIRDIRVLIKHKEFDKAKKMLGGALAKYLTDEAAAADLAQALKIAINSVYGLTSAGFENPFRDNRNKDNIVAKRGALFMINLKHEVQKRGFTVAHIKTDSIKIPDATPEIIQFVMEYGKMYGYTFEHEATYDRMCLVNNAVYIAKYKDGKHAGEWTATGTQFQIPYVFKKLFSHEEITFEDVCETKSVTGALYLDMNEKLSDVSAAEKELADLLKRVDPDGSRPFGADEEIERLRKVIADGHDYVFIGKVGQFCPIKDGCGGGLLCRESVDKKTGEKKYDAATGTKGYRWLESEMVKQLGKEGDINRAYYDALVNAAAHDISQFGDLEWFVSDDPYVKDDTPPWYGPDEPHGDDSTPFDLR